MRRMIPVLWGVVLSVVLLSGFAAASQAKPAHQTTPPTAPPTVPQIPTVMSGIDANTAATAAMGIETGPGCPPSAPSAGWYAYENKLLLQMIGEASSDPAAA